MSRSITIVRKMRCNSPCDDNSSLWNSMAVKRYGIGLSAAPQCSDASEKVKYSRLRSIMEDSYVLSDMASLKERAHVLFEYLLENGTKGISSIYWSKTTSENLRNLLSSNNYDAAKALHCAVDRGDVIVASELLEKFHVRDEQFVVTDCANKNNDFMEFLRHIRYPVLFVARSPQHTALSEELRKLDSPR